jgi:bifunctional DNA-binding transcriptional regulator/antitoxin component of YhaV-PrlF toxin-antitoxin module
MRRTLIVTGSSKGQLTVPQWMREQYGWKPGQKLEFITLPDQSGFVAIVLPTSPEDKTQTGKASFGKYRLVQFLTFPRAREL